MKSLWIFGLGVCFLFGLITCRSSEQISSEEPEPSMDNLPNLVDIERPASSEEVTEQRVYVENVEWEERENTRYLLIRGNFPNPCCRLDTVTQSISGNEIYLSLTAWQPAGSMCSQVLKPFSYLHRLPDSFEPASSDSLTVTVNNTEFKLQQP